MGKASFRRKEGAWLFLIRAGMGDVESLTHAYDEAHRLIMDRGGASGERWDLKPDRGVSVRSPLRRSDHRTVLAVATMNVAASLGPTCTRTLEHSADAILDNCYRGYSPRNAKVLAKLVRAECST